ncbi:MAG: beta-phosphoglucomutase family hydrolase [Dehalococcoidia bacterium]|nr:beta-phosphoglucomutase family hydrolase [Dehalococcoidia bacterium]
MAREPLGARSTVSRAAISTRDIGAVIFDMDGVVTDTAVVHAAAWKRLFDDYLERRAKQEGTPWQPFEDDDYRRYVDGRPRYDGVAAFLESRGISLPHGSPDDPPQGETVCALGNRKNAYFLQHVSEHGAKVYQSTVDLIRELGAKGVRTALFTASQNAGPVLEAAGVIELFEARVDGNDAQRLKLEGKPAPDVLLEAARRIGATPERTAVVEDAIAGVQAGRAGRFVLVIGVNRSEQPGELLANGAHVEVSDLAEVTVVDDAER